MAVKVKLDRIGRVGLIENLVDLRDGKVEHFLIVPADTKQIGSRVIKLFVRKFAFDHLVIAITPSLEEIRNRLKTVAVWIAVRLRLVVDEVPAIERGEDVFQLFFLSPSSAKQAVNQYASNAVNNEFRQPFKPGEIVSRDYKILVGDNFLSKINGRAIAACVTIEKHDPYQSMGTTENEIQLLRKAGRFPVWSNTLQLPEIK